MTNQLTVLMDRLEGEHVDVLKVGETLRVASKNHDGAGLLAALAAGQEHLGDALTAHSVTEDDDLFPAIAPLIGEGLVSIFVEEHVRIRALRDQVYERAAKGEADFDGCAELCDLLESHMEREEQVLFPAARGSLDD